MSVEINDNRFGRIELLLGANAVSALKQAFVVVVGLGAVGSYAVEALARAGIGRLRLVDFDEIRTANFNRQLYALESTVGRKKSDVAAQRVKEINPDCTVEELCLFFATETADQVLSGSPDLVIDAIDSLGPKVELLMQTQQRSLEIISVMGAASRVDPLAVRFGSLTQVKNCPLARAVRQRLRRRGASTDLNCVYSIEPSVRRDSTVDCVEEEEFYERGRKRTPLGSLPTLTGIFGLTAAHQAIRFLTKAR